MADFDKIAKVAKIAKANMNKLSTNEKNQVLISVADDLVKNTDALLAANDIDIKNAPDAVIVGHRVNHPYREPRGIAEEVKAIESVEPTKVVGLSINLRNADEGLAPSDFEDEFGLPAVDVYNEGASRLLDAILNHLNEDGE